MEERRRRIRHHAFVIDVRDMKEVKLRAILIEATKLGWAAAFLRDQETRVIQGVQCVPHLYSGNLIEVVKKTHSVPSEKITVLGEKCVSVSVAA